jgi:hypothetical protein
MRGTTCSTETTVEMATETTRQESVSVAAPVMEMKPREKKKEEEVLAMEDIYRAAGIIAPRKGYSINKVVEMLHSEPARGAEGDETGFGADGAGCSGDHGGGSALGREGETGSDRLVRSGTAETV